MIVTRIAVVFKYHGMVIIWTEEIGILFEIINPAKMLPKARRLIGFTSIGLFSLIVIKGGNRGFDIKAKKIIRRLYTAVREVANSVISRAQAFV